MESAAYPHDPARADGRFSRMSAGFHELLDRAALVARSAAGGAEPTGISREQFNGARATADPALPTAQGLCKRLGVARFSDVIRLALLPASERGGRGALAPAEQVSPEFPADLMARVLQAAAFGLGHPPASAYEYDAWVAAERTRRARARLLANPLPDSSTILGRFADWPGALAAAGLEAEPGPRSPRAANTLDAFIDEMGFLPANSYFERWCARRDIPLGRDSRVWADVVAACRAERTARGKWTPEALTPTRNSPPLPAPAAGRRPSGRRATEWSEERILAALRRYGQLHLNGAKPTQRHYRACAKGDPELPSPSTITAHGMKFQEACQKAGI
jgi:hypothetical protein